MINVYFHVSCMGNHWRDIVEEIVSAMTQNGLYTEANQVHYSVIGTQDDFTWLKSNYSNLDKVTWHYHGSRTDQYEFPTMELLMDNAKIYPEAKYLYCHTKGVSKNYLNPFFKYWRRYMIKNVIQPYGRHLSLLNTYDISGCMWSDNTHFSGNFWWANGAHINQLPDIRNLRLNPVTIWPSHTFEDNLRLQCEMWIGMRTGIKVRENGILNMKPGFNFQIPGETDPVPCPLNNMNFDKIFLINLEHRQDRLQQTIQQLNKIGLKNVTRFPAINARRLGITKKTLDNPGLIGCFLSHYFILQQAVMAGWKRLLILEDDVNFVNGFNELLQYSLTQLPTDWQLVYLGYTERNGHLTYKEKLSDNITIPNDPWGTQAYMVQGDGIRILYENLQEIKDHIDIQISRHISDKIKVYEIFPSLCPQSGAESDISNPVKNVQVNIGIHRRKGAMAFN